MGNSEGNCKANLSDTRVSRSRKAFTQALIELSREKNAEDISVSAIAKKAGYSRNTFYLQYGSYEGFLQAVVDDEISLLRSTSNFPTDIQKDFPFSLLLSTNEQIYSRRELYRLILSTRSPINMASYYQERMLQVYTDRFVDSPAEIERQFFLHMFYSMTWSGVQFWANQGFQWSALKYTEEFLRYSKLDIFRDKSHKF